MHLTKNYHIVVKMIIMIWLAMITFLIKWLMTEKMNKIRQEIP